jgi:hypothetical protein
MVYLSRQMPGLPDGIFSNQKSKFELVLEGLAIEDVCIFQVPLVYFTAIWYIIRPFGIFSGYLVYFLIIWYIFPFWKNLANLSATMVFLNQKQFSSTNHTYFPVFESFFCFSKLSGV